MKTDAFAQELARAEFWGEAINGAATFDLALHAHKPSSVDQRDGEIGLPGYARASARCHARLDYARIAAQEDEEFLLLFGT